MLVRQRLRPSPLITAALLTVAGCVGAPSADPARFSTATRDQQQRALTVARAGDVDLAYSFGLRAAAGELESCPRATRAGNTVTVTTNCTIDGLRFAGRAIATNMPSLPSGSGYDPTQPSEVTVDGYREDDTTLDRHFAMDGKVTVHAGRMIADLVVTSDNLEVHTDATWTTADDGLTGAIAGSRIELTGVGVADIEGRWNDKIDPPTGAVELHGADVLKLDYAASIYGCSPITVDGRQIDEWCINY